MKKHLERAMEKLERNHAATCEVHKTDFYTVVTVRAPFNIHVTVDEKPGTRERVFLAEGLARRAPVDNDDPEKSVMIAKGRAMKAITIMMTGRQIDHNWRYSGWYSDSPITKVTTEAKNTQSPCDELG